MITRAKAERISYFFRIPIRVAKATPASNFDNEVQSRLDLEIVM